MQPEAWDVEHNFMHHYMLGEGRDPDLLERNSEILYHAQIPCHTHTTHTHTRTLSLTRTLSERHYMVRETSDLHLLERDS